MKTPTAPAPAAEFQRIVEFGPAYDRRDPEPAKNYGIGCVTIKFTLVGPLGAVDFSMFTGWFLPHNAEDIRQHEERDGRAGGRSSLAPSSICLGYHSPTPRGEWQTPREGCEYLGGRPCYSDQAYVAAVPLLSTLVAGGSDALWARLEREYAELFTPATAAAE